MFPAYTLTLILNLMISYQSMVVTRIFREIPGLLMQPKAAPEALKVHQGRVVIPARKWFARGYRRN